MPSASKPMKCLLASPSFKMPGSEPVEIRARTKIVATVGPASEHRLEELVEAGVDVFRLNTAHGTVEERDRLLADIRRISESIGRPIGVLCDLAGPKIRLKQLLKDPLECARGQTYTFVRGDPGKETDLASNYEPLIDELNVGDAVKLADGVVSMRVVEKLADCVRCVCDGGGLLRSKQGINLPGVKLSVPSMTEKDHANALWAAANQVDFVSLSFVRTAQELLDLKAILREHGSEAWVFAKVEKAEAVANLEEIVQAADGIMVARGDLGVEMDIAETPMVQKRLVTLCHRYAKPVIVATQMLDSMQHSRMPTRAEVSDVANAILDGADACMLSGESAIGEYPVEAVEMMNRVALATEPLLEKRQMGPPVKREDTGAGVSPTTRAVVDGAAHISKILEAKLVIVSTTSGATARVRAKQQDFTPTVVVSSREETLRKMTILWGVVPLRNAPLEDVPHLVRFVDRWGTCDGTLEKGDKVVLVMGVDKLKQTHNCVLVHEVQ